MHIFHSAMQHIIKAPSTEAAITAGEEPSALGKGRCMQNIVVFEILAEALKAGCVLACAGNETGSAELTDVFQAATFY